MKFAARFLTAMAVVSLAIMYIATRDQLQDASAATGVIDALNVGTCYATDDKAFSKANCLDGSSGAYEVAGRKDITKADPLYATYAVDPKTSAESPRAIIFNGDLIMISIKDAGRDKRTGVLFAVNGGTGGAASDRQTLLTGPVAAYRDTIVEALGADNVPMADHDEDGDSSTTNDIFMRPTLTETGTTLFELRPTNSGASTDGHILNSVQLELLMVGDNEADHPMAPLRDDTDHGMKLGKMRFFGFLQDDMASAVAPTNAEDFEDLTRLITIDEDFGCIPDSSAAMPDANCDGRAPWAELTFEVPADERMTLMYVYYETSEQEEIVGGKKKSDYTGWTVTTTSGDVTTDTVRSDMALENIEQPAFVGDEDAGPDDDTTTVAQRNDQKALVVSAGADGEKESRNLWLKETGRFSGTYVGFLRLTDSNGNGSEAGEQEEAEAPDNWGRKVVHATGAGSGKAAVLGVESGPVTVKYRDTDDDDQSISISIDTAAPTISIDSPANETATRDASPNMSGQFADSGSGLRKDSFKLFADNNDDDEEDGDNGDPVFDLKVNLGTAAAHVTRGKVVISGDTIDIAGNYEGYDTAATDLESTFGIVKREEVYYDEDETYTKRVDGENEEFDKRKVVDAEAFDDGATRGEFDESVRFDFSAYLANETFNNTIDFQAAVMDRAGNIGFSDSDLSTPRFIHEYGLKAADRKEDKHNVLGWYSRHILFLDLVDPAVQEDESATGFFGVDGDDDVRSNNGVMVVFDKPISSSDITIATFDVTLGDGSDATVTEVLVSGRKVYLLLEETLDANETPKVDLASGEVIRDLAGNSTVPREFDEIELSDGILPTFTVTLSGGSGLMAPTYGPDKITKDRMTIRIESNEPIQGAPKFALLCNAFQWHNLGADSTAAADIAAQRETNDVAKYVSNRTGSKTTGAFADAEPTAEHINTAGEICAYDDDSDLYPNPTKISTTTALQRGTNRWEYQWSNIDKLRDGGLTVVVTGRDRGGFKSGDDSLVNYGTATAGFTLDTELAKPTTSGGGEVIPEQDEAVSEPRPFVLIDFSEKTPVTVTQFNIDGDSVLDSLEELDNNRFVYWPEPLGIGKYTVKVEANDAANNTTEFQYSFTVRDRLPFSLNLLAGWNTISFPANPMDRSLHAVFTETEIDQVIGWDATNSSSPWRAATRVDGVWTTGEDYAVLNDVESRYGYWVHSTGFVTQSVKLVGKGDRIGPFFENPADVPTKVGGWNFVGVVDVDGDQTEDNAGQTLLNSKKSPITASQYLGGYRNAYTWNNIDNKWQRMRPDGPVTIGTGIWVYYTNNDDIAP